MHRLPVPMDTPMTLLSFCPFIKTNHEVKVRPRYKFIGLILSLFLTFVSCTSAKELIETEYNSILQPEATLLFNYAFVSTSATGDCASSSIDRWYGTQELYDNIMEIFESQLSESGWIKLPDESGQIWRKQTRDGLFTFTFRIFTREEKINPNRAYYILPNDVLLEADRYASVYITSLSYMFPSVAESCFKSQ